jgi:hypothetical protein
MSGDGHIIPHHEKILAKGYRGIQLDAQEALKSPGLAQDQIDFYNAVVIAMRRPSNSHGAFPNLQLNGCRRSRPQTQS